MLCGVLSSKGCARIPLEGAKNPTLYVGIPSLETEKVEDRKECQEQDFAVWNDMQAKNIYGSGPQTF